MGTHLAGGVNGVGERSIPLQGEPDRLAGDTDLQSVEAAGKVAGKVAEPGGQRFRDSTDLTVVDGIDSYHGCDQRWLEMAGVYKGGKGWQSSGFWIDSNGAGSVGEERAMKRERALREIMEQATQEMREVLSLESEEDGAEQWDPDAWEEELIRFSRELNRKMLQTWAEVKAEQAKAQAPFAPAAREDANCTGGSP